MYKTKTLIFRAPNAIAQEIINKTTSSDFDSISYYSQHQNIDL